MQCIPLVSTLDVIHNRLWPTQLVPTMDDHEPFYQYKMPYQVKCVQQLRIKSANRNLKSLALKFCTKRAIKKVFFF